MSRTGELMRRSLLVVVVVLLTSIVGYMALDRHEKDVAHAKDQAFGQKFAR
jgi:hypothetical protein